MNDERLVTLVYQPVEAFILCPTPGCNVKVWGPTRTENHCTAHGGNPLHLMEVVEDDCFGNPQEPGEVPPPARAPLLGLECE